MGKFWLKKNKQIKHCEFMNEEYREDITPEKDIFEVVSNEKTIEPNVIVLKEFKLKFVTIQAYRLCENSTVHCADGKKLLGQAGDYYVQLDRVQEFILPEEVFRKMFLLKIDK